MVERPLPLRREPRLNAMTVVLGLAVAVLLVIVVYPLLWLLLAAFGLPNEFGLSHFVRAYARSQNVQPLVNTIILAIGAGFFSVVLGVPLAWATACTDMPLRKTVRACVALSYITPPYLTALAFIILMGPDAGYLNRLVRLVIDVPSGPFNVFGMTGIILVISLHVFAFTYFLTEAALKSVDASLEEAAQMLGARRWTTVVRINLPLVAPAITGGALLAAVESLALFGPQSFLGTPAQISFLPTRIYGVISSYPPRWGEAAALSLILILLTCIGLLIQRSYLQRRSYVTIGGKGGRQRPARLGAWKWPLLGLCLLIVFFSAIAPVGVLVLASFSDSWVAPLSSANFTLRHFQSALLEDQMAVRGIWNSFRLATAAGLIAVVIGAAIAYIDLRTRVTGRRLLDYLALLPLGLPGTVMAIGLLLAFIRPPLVLYGTIWILLVAYVARFIPLATRSVNSSLRQLEPSLEEAARITGATWMQSIRLILLPLVRPGLVVAFLLVFIPAFAELSATVLLYSSGTETISIAIFRLNDLGQLEVVSALSVFTIAVVLIVSLGLNWYSARLPKRRQALPKD
ncbi:ABC transporter permease [Geminicoccus roseus]|uniref:ABC transporter permease n=1 Tax=Geminicoccus roseus TaxID=404900 RepID=UPI0004066937|nr:iron ABC transporter permease [Geminicoccus roseus]